MNYRIARTTRDHRPMLLPPRSGIWTVLPKVLRMFTRSVSSSMQFITDNTIQFLIISLILSPCHANHKSVFLNQSTESLSLKPISSFLVCYYLFFNEMLDILLICSYSVVGLECYRPISGVCCIPYQCYNATWVREDREYWDTCFRDPHCPLPP